jgi:hypothetical protein
VSRRGLGTGLLLLPLLAGATGTLQLDDPTRPPGHRLVLPGGARSTVTTWRVSAIYLSAGQRSAIINGRLVRTGSRVGGARVVEILANRVWLKKNGQRFAVPLITDKIKKQLRTVQQ